jgi:glutamate/tyrosine decarboxylase-like PLP-dependent enzyme
MTRQECAKLDTCSHIIALITRRGQEKGMMAVLAVRMRWTKGSYLKN